LPVELRSAEVRDVLGWLVFLPVAVGVMCFALYRLWRDEPLAQSPQQRYAVARTGCRLAVVSSLMLAAAGLGGFQGPAWVLGWLMIVLGLGGVITGSVVFQRYLGETGQPQSTRQPEDPPAEDLRDG
jgi:hypothetical protein